MRRDHDVAQERDLISIGFKELAGKVPVGKPPTEANIHVDLVIEEPLKDVVRKFVGSMKILDAGPKPIIELGAIGLGMDRLAPPIHYEIVTKLEHRDDFHYHRYDVYRIAPPASCCWKGYFGEFTAETTGTTGQTKVMYRGHMDTYPCCPCAPSIIASAVKDMLSKPATPSPNAMVRC